jgi:hypothetical protein
MRMAEMEYSQYAANEYPLKQKVRDINECTVWMVEDRLLLILDDPTHLQVALFHYDSSAEFRRDRDLVMRIDLDGGPEAAAPAWLLPVAPTRSAGAAQDVPRTEGQRAAHESPVARSAPRTEPSEN